MGEIAQPQFPESALTQEIRTFYDGFSNEQVRFACVGVAGIFNLNASIICRRVYRVQIRLFKRLLMPPSVRWTMLRLRPELFSVLPRSVF